MDTADDSPIEAQRKLVAEIRAHLGREELILEGMERMAAFAGKKSPSGQSRRSSSTPSAALPQSGSRGRQPGAISKRWRVIFNALVLRGNHFDDDMVIRAVNHFENRTMRKSEVRRLFETHRANDLVAFNDDGTYAVTEYAIQKFGLGQKAEEEAPAPSTYLRGSIAPKEDEPRSVPAGGPYHGRPEASPFRRPWETHPTVQG